MEYYEIIVRGESYMYVYNTQDIIKESCELVNGCGVSPEDIEVKTHKRG